MPGRALGRARPVRPVTALISPVVPFRATSFTIRLARSAPMSMRKPTTDCVALHYGGGAALNAEPHGAARPPGGGAGGGPPDPPPPPQSAAGALHTGVIPL